MRHPDLLSDCLVDSDQDALHRAKLRRRKAIIISLAAQAILLSLLLLTPIFAPASLPARYTIMPIPPYGGGGRRAPERPATNSPQSAHPTGVSVHLPTAYPLHPSVRPSTDGDNDAPPDIGVGVPGGCDACCCDGGIPGGWAVNSAPQPPVRRPPAAPPKPVVVNPGVQAAKLIYRIDPVYPDLARRIHLQGVVELHAIIGTDGRVKELQVWTGNPILTQPASEAVRQWRYQPTLLNGQPVEVQTVVTVKFVLQ